jgi:hypothetical protein
MAAFPDVSVLAILASAAVFMTWCSQFSLVLPGRMSNELPPASAFFGLIPASCSRWGSNPKAETRVGVNPIFEVKMG